MSAADGSRVSTEDLRIWPRVARGVGLEATGWSVEAESCSLGAAALATSGVVTEDLLVLPRVA